MVRGDRRLLRVAGEVVGQRRREHEVAVGQALHQRRGAQAVGAVVGEVGLADREQARDGGLQVVVDPQAAHGVVDRRVDAHGDPVGVLAGDPLVHLEEVAVPLGHRRPAQARDRVGEVEVDPQPAGADPAPLVADALGGAGGDVAGDQVAEGRVEAFQVVVALVLGDPLGAAAVALGPRHPDPAVVAQRLAHQGELGLVLARARDAGRVDLGEAGVGEVRAAPVGAPDRRRVGVLRVGGQVEDVAVAAGGQHHRVREVAGDLAGDQVAGDDAAGAAVDHDQVEHLGAGVHLHVARGDLPRQRLVGAQEQLLAGLAPGVEGPLHLDAAEGAGVQQPAVLAGERDALGHALVDDLHRDLGQAVDVGLAGAEVPALDRVVEQPVHAVAVVAVVLRRVDAALGGDRVGPARGVLVAELDDAVALFGQRGPGRAAGQAGADHDHGVLAAVGRVDQPGLEPAGAPALLDGPFGRPGVGQRIPDAVVGVAGGGAAGGGKRTAGGGKGTVGGGKGTVGHQRTAPIMTATGTVTKPANRTRASTQLAVLKIGPLRGPLPPSVWAALQKPWRTCSPSAAIATM